VGMLLGVKGYSAKKCGKILFFEGLQDSSQTMALILVEILTKNDCAGEDHKQFISQSLN
jgi:hypothetical protein